jgi:hypothetical protein
LSFQTPSFNARFVGLSATDLETASVEITNERGMEMLLLIKGSRVRSPAGSPDKINSNY